MQLNIADAPVLTTTLLLKSETGLHFPPKPESMEQQKALLFLVHMAEDVHTFWAMKAPELTPALATLAQKHFGLEFASMGDAQADELREWAYRATRWLDLFRDLYR